ncbi:Na/Pi cotransporter family protein [Rhizobium sp. P38BS-XIX]|uniref:Na/Pi cotransporter family protein n=1 Tax=Rhizobium sp. P38BS-XIX TaxID=2726740 RepID=UPI001456A90A|nr:Na/Pi cotransporter family protein [Rhizobium sp. P38BS-XIX]NLR97142.1 Na/Pi cotransporter family protein [Rhizobium sp. P38BS-XIX]
MALFVGLIALAGHIALLLWGTRMVQTGIQRAFGPNLRSFLGHALSNRVKAFFAGMGVTAILQSSTATGLMASGFAAGGLVDLVPALAVMLGANVGTTLIVQVLSFDVSAASPALVLIGVLMFRRVSNPQVHDLGRVVIGLGFMLLALHQLLELMTQYEGSSALSSVLAAISATPVLSILLAAVLTWAAHSSVAVVLLIVSLASKGLIQPEQAFALVLGANLGTAINPVVEGHSGSDLSHKRLPIGNLLTRIIGVTIALLLLSPIARLSAMIDDNNARAVANFHTAFNLVLAALFMPFLSPYADALTKMFPRKVDESDPARPRYLDPAARETPVVALGAAAREALRLVDVLTEMLTGAKAALSSTDRKALSALRAKDNVLDSLNTAVKTYLTSIDPDELGEVDKRRLNEILLFSMNMEHAGDVLDQNLLPHLAKRLRRGLNFSKEGQLDLSRLFDRLTANLQTAAALFMTQDERAARLLADEKVLFRKAEREGTEAHFQRLRDGSIETMETSSLHLDLVRDLKQINSHLVAAAAYPVLEERGELLQSRTVKPDGRTIAQTHA